MFTFPDRIDVLIVGSGHAGIEAALAAARLGCRTLMLTQNLDTIGQMSCNPAIGGSAKSHIVKEIDALGGAMAINGDATGIQFRVLNRSKGEAVWATRVQCDKKAYQFRLKATLEKTPNLRLLQGTAATLAVADGRVLGVTTDLGMELRAKSVVITAGTFLRGLFHVEQLPCWLTHTTSQTHKIINTNLHRSPLYQNRIKGAGPRYCPSIEDKIVRFSHKASHPIFLEPEGRHCSEIYVNGISTSLP